MSILAVLEVQDDGSATLKGFRDSLLDLAAAAQSAGGMVASAGQQFQSPLGAMGALTTGAESAEDALTSLGIAAQAAGAQVAAAPFQLSLDALISSVDAAGDALDDLGAAAQAAGAQVAAAQFQPSFEAFISSAEEAATALDDLVTAAANVGTIEIQTPSLDAFIDGVEAARDALTALGTASGSVTVDLQAPAIDAFIDGIEEAKDALTSLGEAAKTVGEVALAAPAIGAFIDSVEEAHAALMELGRAAQGTGKLVADMDQQLQAPIGAINALADSAFDAIDALAALGTATQAVGKTAGTSGDEVADVSKQIETLEPAAEGASGSLQEAVNVFATMTAMSDPLKKGIGNVTNATAAMSQALNTAATGTFKIVNGQFVSLAQNAVEAGSGLTEVTKGAKAASGGINSLTQTFKVAQQALVALAGAAGFGMLLREAGEMAARGQVLSTVMSVVAKNAKLAGAELHVQAEQIKALGISSAEAADAVIQFAQANLRLGDAAKLARVAQDLAVISGQNSSQAFQTLTAAIQVQQTRMLRQFGIVTNLTAIYGKFAQEVNKTVKELSESEKKQAFVNFVLEKGEAAAGTYAAAMNDAGKLIGSFSRFVNDAKEALGAGLLPVMLQGVQTATNLLKMWLALTPETQRLVLAFGVFITAVLSLVAAFKALQALQILSTLGALASGWGVLVVALGAATAATVAYTDANKINSKEHVENVAKLRAEVVAIEELEKKISELEKVKKLDAEQTKSLNSAYEKMAQLVPGLTDHITDLAAANHKNADAVQRYKGLLQEQMILEGRKADDDISKQLALKKEAWEKETAARSALAAAEDRYKMSRLDAQARLARGEITLAEVTNQGQKSALFGKTELNKVAIQAVLTAGTALDQAEEQRRTTEKQLALHLQNKQTILELTDADARHNAILRGRQEALNEVTESLKINRVELERMAKVVKFDYSKLTANKTDIQRFQTDLQDLQRAIEEYRATQEEATKKAGDAYTKMLEKMRGPDPITKAQFQALNVALGEVTKGSEEYNRRVQLATPELQAAAVATADMTAGLTHLNEAVKDAQQLGFDKTAQEWGLKATASAEQVEEAAIAIREAFTSAAQGVTDNLGKQLTEQAKAQEEELYQARVEIYEKTVVAKMNEVDQAIYAEQKRLAGIQKAMLAEETARNDMIDAARREVTEKAELAKQEIQDAIKKSEALYEIEVTRLIATERIRKTGTTIRQQHELDEDAASVQRALDLVRVMNEQTQVRINNDIDASLKGSLELIQISQDTADGMTAAAKKGYQAQVQLSEITLAEIKKQHDEARNFIIGTYHEITSGFMKGLGQMLTGAKSFKDEMVGIWESLKQSLFKIIDGIFQKWTDNLFKIIQAGGPSKIMGGESGFGGLLKGVFGPAKSLLGGGSAIPAVGAYASGGINAVPMAAGVPAYALGPSAAAPSAFVGPPAPAGWLASHGVTGAAVAGGTLAAAGGGLVGYGVGRYLPNRPTGALAGAGAGAMTGLAIGSVVPGIGNLAGFIIGGIAGAIGGWLSGGKKKREVIEARGKFLDDLGEDVKAKIDPNMMAKLMKADSAKELNAEIEKIVNGLKVAEMLGSFADSRGGMRLLEEEAKKAGVSLESIFKAGIKAEDLAKEIEKVQKALDFKKAKDEFISVMGGMEELESRAAAAGVALDEMWKTENIEAFSVQAARVADAIKAFEMKDAFLAAQGGLEELTAAADKAGVSLERFLEEGRTSEEVAKEIEKIRQALDMQRAKDNLVMVHGGMEQLQKDAERAGVSLDKAFSTKSPEVFAAEMERIQQAFAMQKGKDRLVALYGGFDELTARAKAAGVSIDVLFSTKSPEVFAFELQKVQFALERLGMIEAAGGIDEFTKRALAAGITIEELNTLLTTMDPEEFAYMMERVGKAMELKDAKDGLAQTRSEMLALQKAAQLVGFDLQRLYNADTIEEFNGQQAILNKLLEEQQQRLAGLATAASGLEKRVAGLNEFGERGIGEFFDTFSKKQKEAFEDAYKLATEKKGFKGSEFDFFQQGGKAIKDLKLDPKQTEQLKKVLKEVQTQFDLVGTAAVGTFAAIVRETGDVIGAMEQIGPTLDELIAQQDSMGLKASESLNKLLGFRRVIKANNDVANSLSGITQIINGLAEAGALTQDVFKAMGADAAAQFDILTQRGVGAEDKLALMQPTLQALWQAQKDFGFATDENTQKLIDMGVEQGVVGENFQSTSQKMLDILVAIGNALGADIPAAYQKVETAAEQAARMQENHALDAAQNAEAAGENTGETLDTIAADSEKTAEETAAAHEASLARISEAYSQLRDQVTLNIDQWLDYAAKIAEQTDTVITPSLDRISLAVIGVGSEVDRVTQKFIDMGNTGAGQFLKVENAATGAAVGHSPGGVREISTQLAIAALEMSKFSDTVVREMDEIGRRVLKAAENIKALPEPIPKGSGGFIPGGDRPVHRRLYPYPIGVPHPGFDDDGRPLPRLPDTSPGRPRPQKPMPPKKDDDKKPTPPDKNPPSTSTPEPPKIVINNTFSPSFNMLDPEDFSKVIPQLKKDFDNNTQQLAASVEHSLQRYRKRK